MSYDIELMLNDQMIGAWRNIALQKNESWSKTIDLPGPGPASTSRGLVVQVRRPSEGLQKGLAGCKRAHLKE